MRKMNSLAAALAFAAILWPASPLAAQSEHVDYVAEKDQYKNEPFLRFIPSIPQVMIVLERDWKIFYPAYSNLNDLNGDGSIDNGFNPSITYIGYFDVDSCYSHDGAKFVRASSTTPQTQAEANAKRPSGLKANIPSPVSNHGVCPEVSSTGRGGARWAGNWPISP